MEEYQNRLGAVWKKYDCNPFKSILGVFAQAPLFIGFFSALRAMALHKVPARGQARVLPYHRDQNVAARACLHSEGHRP